MTNYILIVVALIICSCNRNQDNTLSIEESDENKEITILSEREGEVFSPDMGGRTTIIKVSPKTGSKNLSMVIQKLPDNTRIPVHKHDHTEEVFFVKGGTGELITENDTIMIKEGDAIYVPPGHWHGFENEGDSLYIIFVVTPPGLDEFFREKETNKGLTQEQIDDIARKHDQINKN